MDMIVSKWKIVYICGHFRFSNPNRHKIAEFTDAIYYELIFDDQHTKQNNIPLCDYGKDKDANESKYK